MNYTTNVDIIENSAPLKSNSERGGLDVTNAKIPNIREVTEDINDAVNTAWMTASGIISFLERNAPTPTGDDSMEINDFMSHHISILMKARTVSEMLMVIARTLGASV